MRTCVFVTPEPNDCKIGFGLAIRWQQYRGLDSNNRLIPNRHDKKLVQSSQANFVRRSFGRHRNNLASQEFGSNKRIQDPRLAHSMILSDGKSKFWRSIHRFKLASGVRQIQPTVQYIMAVVTCPHKIGCFLIEKSLASARSSVTFREYFASLGSNLLIRSLLAIGSPAKPIAQAIGKASWRYVCD